MEISTEQPDMIAKKAASGEAGGGGDDFPAEGNSQEAPAFWFLGGSPSSSAVKPRIPI